MASKVEACNGQQAWLAAAYKAIQRDLVKDAPDNVLLSYGFPKGRSGRGKRIGECWQGQTLPEGQAAIIFIHPCQWTSAADVLHVLVHEALHASLPMGTGHKAPFPKRAREVGLEGKPTSTVAGEELKGKLVRMAERLPAFPKAPFDSMGKGEKKPGSRLRKWVCGCDVIARVASDDFDATCNLCDEAFKQE